MAREDREIARGVALPRAALQDEKFVACECAPMAVLRTGKILRMERAGALGRNPNERKRMSSVWKN